MVFATSLGPQGQTHCSGIPCLQSRSPSGDSACVSGCTLCVKGSSGTGTSPCAIRVPARGGGLVNELNAVDQNFLYDFGRVAIFDNKIVVHFLTSLCLNNADYILYPTKSNFTLLGVEGLLNVT